MSGQSGEKRLSAGILERDPRKKNCRHPGLHAKSGEQKRTARNMWNRTEDLRCKRRPIFDKGLHNAPPGFTILPEGRNRIRQIPLQRDGAAIVEWMSERRGRFYPAQTILCERQPTEEG